MAATSVFQLAVFVTVASVSSASDATSTEFSSDFITSLAQQWKLRITYPVSNSWIESTAFTLGFTGSVPENTDVSSLQVCISLDGGAPNCMGFDNVVLHGLSDGAHSVAACWRIPGYGSCFDHTFSARQIVNEEVPGRDQVSFVVVRPFQHSAVQWNSNTLGQPLPYSV
jgi:hypothetical protein